MLINSDNYHEAELREQEIEEFIAKFASSFSDLPLNLFFESDWHKIENQVLIDSMLKIWGNYGILNDNHDNILHLIFGNFNPYRYISSDILCKSIDLFKHLFHVFGLEE